MRRRLLFFWLTWALRAMERAAKFSPELLADRHLDDLALSYNVNKKLIKGVKDGTNTISE